MCLSPTSNSSRLFKDAKDGTKKLADEIRIQM